MGNCNTKKYTDCRTCNRRRIRCDRGRPACSKCVERGLSCPGYDKPLKWICGAVSKGPNRRQFGGFGGSDKRDARILTAPAVISSNDPASVSQTPHLYSRLPTTSSPIELLGLRPVLPQQGPMMISEQPLLCHFVNVISKELAWYEDGSNPWRCLILPLAFQSRSLLSVILGIAASNITSQLESHGWQKQSYTNATTFYRNNTLRLLSEDIRSLRCSLDILSTSDRSQVNAVVATTLLLSYLEIHCPSSGAWRNHLDAAQRLRETMEQVITGNDSTSHFLAEELFSASTWPMLTAHHRTSASQLQRDNIACDESSTRNHSDKLNLNALGSYISPFTGFLFVMRFIANVERACTTHCDDDTKRKDEQSLQTAFQQTQVALVQVRHHAVRRMESIPMAHRFSETKGLVHLISAYFYATTIYSYQALYNDSSTQSTVLRLRHKLIQSLLALGIPGCFTQDQPWPLFVLGTESIHDEAVQQWIESQLTMIIQKHCTFDRSQMLYFLKSFWGQSEEKNWIQYARQGTRTRYELLIW